MMGACVAAAALSTFACSREARADESSIRFLSNKLKDSDARVRTSAALALGATNDDVAVAPLCTALSDSDEVVRQAVSAGLKRLGRSSAVPCLSARVDVEAVPEVKASLLRALESISATNDDAIKDNPKAKYYIALAPIANQTARAGGEVERLVRASLRKQLDQTGIMQLAPSSETSERVREVMKSRKMKGYFLSVAVEQLDYADGGLRATLKIAVCSYPNRAILGSFNKTQTAAGISEPDRSIEDRLLESAAGRVAETFAEHVSDFE